MIQVKAKQPSPDRPPDPEYVAVIIAATQGARLFPLTAENPGGVPKHLLTVSPLNKNPIITNHDGGSGEGGPEDGGGGGLAPILQRLIRHIFCAHFEMVVIAINHDDKMTVPFLMSGLCGILSKKHESSVASSISFGKDSVTDLEYHACDAAPVSFRKDGDPQSQSEDRWMHVRVVRLPEECNGSADALRFISRGNNPISRMDDQSPSPSKNSILSDGQNENFSYIPRTSAAVVMPGDLFLEGGLLSLTGHGKANPHDGGDVLSLLVQAHRRWNAGGSHSPTAAACTMLLTDVGAENTDGVPLKESSKAKMGLLSREEEDMEYIGLSSEVPLPLSASLASLSHRKLATSESRRVVLKRSKLEVEEDEGTGSTPKIVVPKRRLHCTSGNYNGRGIALARSAGGISVSSTAMMDHSPAVSLRTDLCDIHLYVISNWVFELIHARPSMQSFQGEVLPLLISRQFRGVEAAFGSSAWKVEANRERLRKVLLHLDGESEEELEPFVKISSLLGIYASRNMSGGGIGNFVRRGGLNPAADELNTSTPKAEPSSFPTSKHRFAVSAQVLSREASALTLRACTLPSLLYGCNEVTSRILKLDPSISSSEVPKGAKLSTKFNSILMPECEIGEKVQTKSCTIGAKTVLGDRARLNNTVLMGRAEIGSNSVLQNSIVGAGAKIGENCNLKDCQVGPGAHVQAGTRTSEKGEAFHA